MNHPFHDRKNIEILLEWTIPGDYMDTFRQVTWNKKSSEWKLVFLTGRQTRPLKRYWRSLQGERNHQNRRGGLSVGQEQEKITMSWLRRMGATREQDRKLKSDMFKKCRTVCCLKYYIWFHTLIYNFYNIYVEWCDFAYSFLYELFI